MVETPTTGLNSQPPSAAPTIPTTTLSRMPSCVRMTALAAHPSNPPTTSQTRMFMTTCAPIRTGGHATRIRQHDLYGGARMTVAVQPARTYERVMVYAAVVSKGASNDFYIQGFESFLLPGFLPQPNRSLSIARVWRANRNMRSNA